MPYLNLNLSHLLIYFFFSFLFYSTAENKEIVFCWSPNDHPKETHGYKNFADRMTEKFKAVKNIKTSSVEGFPKAEVWEHADLVVFFLTIEQLSKEQLLLLDKHIASGKSLLVLHQGLVSKKSYNEWAERIGFAFSWEKGKEQSKWGTFSTPIYINAQHEIFKGFSNSISFNDELYWNLKKGSQGKIKILGTTQGPDKKQGGWPVFWTVEHDSKARVFCAVPGHFDKVRNSQLFDKVTFRAIAWCLSKPAETYELLLK